MPFPWMHAEIPATITRTFAAKSLDALRLEVRQRARLLMHLQFPESAAVARCRQNLAWEWAGQVPAPLLAEVHSLVHAVYQRH